MIRAADVDGVRVLELDRAPDNSLSRDLLAALREALVRAREDASVKAVVLASPFPKVFSAGLDLSELAPEAGLGTGPFQALIDTHRALAGFPKPSVAAVNGLAILGGWILALACDARVFAEDAKATLSEVRIGLSPTEALVRTSLSLAADPRAVRAMVLRGRPLDASEAAAAGLADRVVPAAVLRAEAVREAKGLARVPPGAFAAVKRDLRAAWGLDDPALWERSVTAFETLHAGEEARAGLAAAARRAKPAPGGRDVP
ncbi:MAG: enoyl-CoA hydratase/isomerase family protein [Elusimicrobia bacterium]|nr:enoyl-CoA hydratase/isomerase family protein [Elusimicrobiota bacterium]